MKKKKDVALHVVKEEEKVVIPDLPKVLKPPILAGLPEYLKDPANYQKIRAALYEVIASTCSHSEVIEWSACSKCQKKVRDHADMVRKLGFTSPAQYFAWRKVHEVMDKRVKLR